MQTDAVPGLPSSPRCDFCERELTRHEAVRGSVCVDPECRRQSEVRREAARIRAVAELRLSRARVFAARRLGAAPGSFAVAVVPANDRSVEPLPEVRRRRFRGSLARTIRAAFVSDALPPEPTPDEGPGDPSEGRVLEKACAACRGHCCTLGGDTAWITPETILRVLRDRRESRRGELLRRYAGHLPARSYPDSCVYHGETGCTLPRDLRAETCNDYYCPDAHALREARRRLGLRPLVLVATDGPVPRRVEEA